MFQWGREDGSTSQTEPVSVSATRVSAQPQPELSLCRGLQGLAPKQRAQGKGHGGHCSKPRCVLPAHALHAHIRGTRSREPVPWHCVAAGQCKTAWLNPGEPSKEKPKREEPWAELLSWWLRAAARRRAGPLEQQQRSVGTRSWCRRLGRGVLASVARALRWVSWRWDRSNKTWHSQSVCWGLKGESSALRQGSPWGSPARRGALQPAGPTSLPWGLLPHTAGQQRRHQCHQH